MNFYTATDETINAGGKINKMDIVQIPNSENISVDIKDVDKFIMIHKGESLMTMNGENMTPELFEAIRTYIKKNIR